jgi:transketolase
LKKNKIKNLKKKALDLRIETFLSFIKKGEAHLGGSFSIIETIIFLFHHFLKKNDKFILSKSHASFPLVLTLRKKGFKTKLTTHLELDPKNRIYCTTGSLGHGLPIATGMAFAQKIQNKKGNIFVMISDGECQEGTTWESFLIATKLKLDNLIILIDYNKIQALTTLADGLPLANLKLKLESFNLNVFEIKNAHSFNSLENKFIKLKKNKRPNAVILNTIKGKGIKEFENDPVWHARQLKGKELLLEKNLRIKIK